MDFVTEIHLVVETQYKRIRSSKNFLRLWFQGGFGVDAKPKSGGVRSGPVTLLPKAYALQSLAKSLPPRPHHFKVKTTFSVLYVFVHKFSRPISQIPCC